MKKREKKNEIGWFEPM